MKKVEAIIRPAKVREACAALERVGHPGVTISDVEGHGNQKGVQDHVRGKTYLVSLLTKKRLEVIVKDEEADSIITAIREAVSTGQIGDGKIFVSSVEEAYRIRTGEQGDEAI